MKYTQTRNELIDHLKEQIEFLKASASHYDKGVHAESKRMATVLRVLLHNTTNSHSLFDLLDIKDKLVYKSMHEIKTPEQEAKEGKVVFRSHTGLEFGPNGPSVFTSLKEPQYDLAFDEWWEQEFVIENGSLTRKNAVLNLANKDGGAHIDPKVNGDYAQITRNNLGWQTIAAEPDGTMEEFQIEDYPALIAVRLITHELLYSLNFNNQLNALLGTEIKFEKKISYKVIPDWESRMDFFENVDDSSPLRGSIINELELENPVTLEDGSVLTVKSFFYNLRLDTFNTNVAELQKYRSYKLGVNELEWEGIATPKASQDSQLVFHEGNTKRYIQKIHIRQKGKLEFFEEQ